MCREERKYTQINCHCCLVTYSKHSFREIIGVIYTKKKKVFAEGGWMGGVPLSLIQLLLLL